MLRVSLRRGDETEYLGETLLTRRVPAGPATLVLVAASDRSLRIEMPVHVPQEGMVRLGCDTRGEPEEWKCESPN